MPSLGVAITWLGHSAFHLQQHPDAPGILIDPWLDNPRAPAAAQALAESARLILLTHGHSDHLDGVAALAQRTGATVLASFEVAAEIGAEGVPAEQLVGFNTGGAASALGITVTLVQAFHSSSLPTADGRTRAVGEANGLIIEFPDGPVVYNTGDTAVFGDMRLLAELYRPAILLLPIGDFYTMGPRQAAKACELVDPTWIIPQHYGTFPGLPGTPEALREYLSPALRDRLLVPAPGETLR